MILYVRLRIAHIFSIKFPKQRGKAKNPCIHLYIFGNPLISENIGMYTRIPCLCPPVGKFDAKNVRNRTWRIISCKKKNLMEFFARRNLDFKIVDLEVFSVILELAWFYRARLHIVHQCFVKPNLALKN